MNKIGQFKFLILILFFISLISCGGGGETPPVEDNPAINNEIPDSTPSPSTPNPTPTPNPTITGSISGIIQHAETKLPLEGLTVTVNGVSTTTSLTGEYSFATVSSGDRVVVTVTGNGFAEQSKIVSINSQDQEVDLNLLVLPVGLTQTFNADVAQDLTVAGSSAMVRIAASSFVQSDGSTLPEGDVTINLTVIDPTLDIELMPGDMQTSTTGGSLAQIESFGAITATFEDNAGNDLNLASGSTATIRIPVPTSSVNPPSTIPLYYYDKTTGLWVEEGSATLNNSDLNNRFYEGSVSHFSTWNADKVYDRVTINGCIENELGEKLKNIYIVSRGVDYSGSAYSYSDSSGNFSVFAKSNASVTVFGYKYFIKTNEISVTTGTSDITLPNCLVLSNVAVNSGDAGGTLTLSGDGSQYFGDQIGFNDIVNYYSIYGYEAIYLLGSEDEDIVNPVPDQFDENNTAFLYFVGDEAERTIVIYITINGQTSGIVCSTSDNSTGSCGTGFVTIDTSNGTVTFNNAVFTGTAISNIGTVITVETIVNGTLTWRDYDLLSIP